MEAQFTIRDTLENFRGWLNAHQTERMKSRAWRNASFWEDEDTFYMDYFTPWQAAHIIIHVRVAEAEPLAVHAAAIWTQEDRDPERRRRDQDVLDAYFTELVRAIRWKWTDEPRLTELERFYLKGVRERPTERGKLEDYCHRLGVTDQTLRNWEKKFQAMGIETKQA